MWLQELLGQGSFAVTISMWTAESPGPGQDLDTRVKKMDPGEIPVFVFYFVSKLCTVSSPKQACKLSRHFRK